MKKGIISILSAMIGTAAGAAAMWKKTSGIIDKKSKMSSKHLALFKLMNQWVQIKQDGKSLDSYFLKKGYNRIAIYGMSYAGETLMRELSGTEVKVVYGIDKNAPNIYAEVEVYSLEDSYPEVDAIVVSAVYFFDEIEEQLRNETNLPVISLEDILYEV